MSYLNSVTLVGFVGSDPEQRNPRKPNCHLLIVANYIETQTSSSIVEPLRCLLLPEGDKRHRQLDCSAVNVIEHAALGLKLNGVSVVADIKVGLLIFTMSSVRVLAKRSFYRTTEDPAVLAKIVERAQENLERLGGFISPSSFERAYLELASEGVIKAFRGSLMDKPAAAPAIPPDVLAFIKSPHTSASELRRRYSTD
jgi:hypothetical protein